MKFPTPLNNCRHYRILGFPQYLQPTQSHQFLKYYWFLGFPQHPQFLNSYRYYNYLKFLNWLNNLRYVKYLQNFNIYPVPQIAKIEIRIGTNRGSKWLQPRVRLDQSPPPKPPTGRRRLRSPPTRTRSSVSRP